MKRFIKYLLALALLPAAAQAQIVGTLPFQLQNGTTADATQVMADFNKILNDVNINAAKNGVNTDITALNALVTPITPVQGGSTIFYAATSGGTANAQTVTSPVPSGFTLATGKRVTFVAGATNTSAMTLNVNSTGATAVLRPSPAGPIALIGGEVVANNYIEAVYDGTQFQLYTNASTPMFGPVTTLASAATTDLGTISSHNVQITGVVTITSFGSTAVLTYPSYQLKFAGVLTLTHNGGLLVLPGGANIVTAAGDTATALYLGSGIWQVTAYNKISGAAVASAVPTIQRFTSSSGTYTTPANTRWIRIRLAGGGAGGGGGGSTSTSGVGTATCWNTTGSACTTPVLQGSGGAGASANIASAAGGAATGGNVLNVAGAYGGPSSGVANTPSGNGGNSVFGGGGGGAPGASAGAAAATNSGSGGGGGGGNAQVLVPGGGGAGGYVEHIITSPAASYTYTVGTGGSGTAGSGGGGVGGAGAAGIIIVEEYY